MKILFVTLYALETNTSVTKSNIGILTGLKQLGHEIVIVMPEIDSNLKYYDNAYDLNHFNIVRIPSGGLGAKMATLNTSPSKLKRSLVNVARIVYGKLSIFDRTKEYINKAKNLPLFDTYFDVILSTSDPKTSHLFAYELIKNGIKYGKWVQHWGDPLSGDISSDIIYPQWYIKRVERKIIENAERVVYVSPFTADSQKKNHPRLSDKIKFVPLACDEQASANKATNCEIANRAVYLGDYSSHIRNILPLYNAVLKMPNIELIIAGNTDLKLESNDNITIYPRVNQQKVKELEDSAAIVVSVGNLSGTQIPGKLYYSASSQKHILVTIDGDNKEELKNYIDSYDRFDVCLNTEDNIREALEKIINEGKIIFNIPDKLLPKNVALEIIG